MSEWINVKDELPKYSQRVLVKDVLVRIGKRIKTDITGEVWEMEGNDESQRKDVQYWMRLPT